MAFASLFPFVVNLMQTLLKLFWSWLLKCCSLQVLPWLRRLFYLCDDNGDELIDSDDLFTMCRELDMEKAFDEVMADIGTGAESLVSLEFVRRGLAVH